MILKQKWEMWVGMSWLCVRKLVGKVMKFLNRGKAAGPDGIINDILRLDNWSR